MLGHKIRRTALVGLSLFLVACAAPTSTGGSSTTAPPSTSTLNQPLGESMTLEPLDILLDPPGADDHAQISPDTAADACETKGVCAGNQPSSVVLARVTDPNSGTMQPDGSVEPLLDHTLVYVVRVDHLACASSGPPRSTTPTVHDCFSASFVDAGTGAVLYEVQASDD